MRFLFERDSNLYSYPKSGNSDFELPTNVKQMGCIEDDVKIYMEDYVYTYLYQFAKVGGNQEKIAVLIGEYTKIGDKNIVIISGAIQGKYSKSIDGVESFTKETWEYIDDQMNEHFKNLKIIGWMHSQPGFGAFLMAKDEKFHAENFKEMWQLLFVVDPVEKIDTLYIYDENKTIHPAKGYFVYYDNKNTNMQDYMIENNKVTKQKDEEVKRLNFEDIKIDNEEIEQKERIDVAKKIRKVMNEKSQNVENTKVRFAMLTGVCAVLCITSASMGVSLLVNQNKLSELESEISQVRTSYVDLSQEIFDSNVSAVFASQNSSDISDTLEVTNYEEAINDDVEKNKEKYEENVVETISVSSSSKKYQVEAGDTLGHISISEYGDDSMVFDIMEVNQIEDADKIFVGQYIYLP